MTLRAASYDDLNNLCQGITKSFVHLETRDAHGTGVELPHMAQWRRGEADDFAWLGWWLDMLRRHRAAGRTSRRARVVAEPLSEYQQWTRSHAEVFADAGRTSGTSPGLPGPDERLRARSRHAAPQPPPPVPCRL